MSQIDGNCQEAKSQQMEKMLQRTAVLHLILCIGIKGEDEQGYVRSTCDRFGVGGREKGERGKPLGSDRK